MKRSALQRKTPMRRTRIKGPSRPRTEHPKSREDKILERSARMAAMAEEVAHLGLPKAVMGGELAQPRPKSPSTRNANLRQLAHGEMCCGCLGSRCTADTTVWAHPNGLADNKGRGYKAHDHLGAFLGAACHRMVDDVKGPEAAALYMLARKRTIHRLREIAGNPLLKPWRIEAARWALNQSEASHA